MQLTSRAIKTGNKHEIKQQEMVVKNNTYETLQMTSKTQPILLETSKCHISFKFYRCGHK